jgi:C-terminal processing protease CtpA/Prc
MQKKVHEMQPSLRLCDVARPSDGPCGFHLTRTAWDPYPWVSGVENGSPAETAGLQAGDCVLEVNGEDVLGQRIGEIASRVRARADRVTLLLWNAGSDPQCSPEVRYNKIKVYVHFLLYLACYTSGQSE